MSSGRFVAKFPCRFFTGVPRRHFARRLVVRRSFVGPIRRPRCVFRSNAERADLAVAVTLQTQLRRKIGATCVW